MADEKNPRSRATIIELDDLVPRSIVFSLHGEEWIIPGDIDVETTFRIQRLLLDMADAEDDLLSSQLAVLSEDAEQREAAGKKQREAFERQSAVTLEMEQEILRLFQVHQPELERLPFGAAAFRAVLAHILVQLGFGEDEEGEEASPPPKPPETMKPPKSRRSSTSTGSRRSSASTPTTGSGAEE